MVNPKIPLLVRALLALRIITLPSYLSRRARKGQEALKKTRRSQYFNTLLKEALEASDSGRTEVTTNFSERTVSDMVALGVFDDFERLGLKVEQSPPVDIDGAGFKIKYLKLVFR